MDAAAVRLLDDGRGQPTETVVAWDLERLPLPGLHRPLLPRGGVRRPSRSTSIRVSGSGCIPAARSTPRRLRSSRSAARAASSVSSRSAAGTALLPTPEERPILTAICDQIAVAVENTRLAAELRRLEAQHEVQRMRSELISAVSHELRTPLGFIKSYATTLLREDTPIEPATRRHFLEIIDEETDKLDHMIDELLDVSRLQAGRLPIDRAPMALDALVARAVDRARPMLEASGHTVTLRLPDGDVPVFADALRIEQVLDNLLENAARYSDPSSAVEISLACRGGTRARQRHRPRRRHRRRPSSSRSSSRSTGATTQSSAASGAPASGSPSAAASSKPTSGRIWAENGHDHATTFVLTLPLTSTGGWQRQRRWNSTVTITAERREHEEPAD